MEPTNPFEDIERMFGQMSQQFGNELVGVPTDVIERDGTYVVRADLPGYDGEDIDVRLTDGRTLEIRARRDGPGTTDGRYVQRERTETSASRTVRLPQPVDTAETSASYDGGVLEVRLAKEAAAGEGTDIPVN